MASTLSRVSVLTSYVSRIARETVDTEMFNSLAILLLQRETFSERIEQV